MIAAALYIDVLRMRLHSFRFFGIIGYIFGVALGVWLAWKIRMSIPVILILSLLGAVIFFLLTIGIRRLTRREILVYYHHEIAIAFCCMMVLTVLHEPVLPYLDIVLLGIGTFLAFGRIGCLMVGCCHGRPWYNGIHYGHDHVSAGFTFYYENIAVFPIQMLESVLVSGIVISGVVMLLNHSQPGAVVILYTVIYGTLRYLLEFFRGDPDRPYWFGLSEAQWTGLLLIGISLAFAEAGHLPRYHFHPVCFFSILFTSLCLIGRRNDLYFKLINPRYIRDIARIVNTPIDENPGSEYTVQIYQTPMGLSISKGRTITLQAICDHYTVSRRNSKLRISAKNVRKLAFIIRQLAYHQHTVTIIEKQEALFQIIFEYTLNENIFSAVPGFTELLRKKRYADT